MEIILCQKSAGANSTKQPAKVSTHTGTLKEETSVLKPTFRVQVGNPFVYNSVYAFDRFYNITDIKSYTGAGNSQNPIWDISCQVDVLATYKDYISNSNLFIGYANIDADEQILADSRLTSQSNESTGYVETTSTLPGASGVPQGYVFFLDSFLGTVIYQDNGDSSGWNGNVINTYQEWKSKLSITDKPELLIKMGMSPISARLLGLTSTGIDIHYGLGVSGGTIDGMDEAYGMAAFKAHYSTTVNLSLSNDDVYFWEATQFGRCFIYLPFAAIYEIPLKRIYKSANGKFNINLRLKIDYDFAQFSVKYTLTDTFSGALILEALGNIGGKIPCTQYDSNNNEFVQGVVQFAAGVGLTILGAVGSIFTLGTSLALSGVGASMAFGGAIKTGAATEASSTDITSSGIDGSAGLAMTTNTTIKLWFYMQDHTTIDNAYYFGRPVGKYDKPSNYPNGFLQTQQADVAVTTNTGITETERQTLNMLLDGGILYE